MGQLLLIISSSDYIQKCLNLLDSAASFFILSLLSLIAIVDNNLVQAGQCQSYEVAYNIEAKMGEGLSLEQAIESVIKQDYSDGSSACFSEIKQEVRQMPYAFPFFHRALYKTTRR